jgi:hypothetical protein
MKTQREKPLTVIHFKTDLFSKNKIIQFDLSIGSILFLKNGLKTICRKSYKNNLRSNDYEVHVYKAVALSFSNILDVMVLENIDLSSDRNMAIVTVV